MTVRVENGRILISFGDEDEELASVEARALANELLDAADEAERQLLQQRRLCDTEGHDWSPWFNGHNPFRNHYRHCQRPGCLDPHEQYPGWMPFAALPHADMFGPRKCSGPGCEHCSTEQLGRIMRTMLSQAAAALTIQRGGAALDIGPDLSDTWSNAKLTAEAVGVRPLPAG